MLNVLRKYVKTQPTRHNLWKLCDSILNPYAQGLRIESYSSQFSFDQRSRHVVILHYTKNNSS
jgi:hypothetical protein